MAATAQPNIGTKEGYAAGDNGWVGDFNFLNRAIDGLVQSSVKAIQAAPPGSPVRGDCYIVATGGSGAWAGWDGRFVRHTGSAWESWIAKDGWYVYNQADATAYRRKSGAWVVDDFLPKNNPTFTGNITGSGSMVWKSGAVSYFSMYAGAVDWGLRDLADDGSLVNYPLVVKRGAAGEIQLGYTGGARPVRIGGSLRIDSTLAQGVTERITAGGEGRFDGLRVSGLTSGALLKAADANGQFASAVANTDYLPVNNPTFTGRLSGNDLKIGSASSAGWLQLSTNNTGTGTFSLDFLGGASSNRRMTIRWSDPLDQLLLMSSADDGTARLDRIVIPRSSSLPIAVAGGMTVNGGFRAQTAVDASSFQWTPNAAEGLSFFGSTSSANDGYGFASLIVHSNDSEAAGRNLGGLNFAQKVSGKSGGYPGLKAFIRGETYGSGGSVGGFGGRVVVAARGDNASSPSDVASFDTTKVTLATGIPLYQGVTERITAGGDGRFESLRAAGLTTSDRAAVYIGDNGQLTKSSFFTLNPMTGPRFGAVVRFVDAYYNGTSEYLMPSFSLRPDTVDEGNAPLGLDSGDFWNSKKSHAIGITDGAVGSPYIGKVRADRWVGTSLVSISGTTSHTSWFAAGTGSGSPTLPTNYLRPGRRVRVLGRVSCNGCEANPAPEITFKIGGTTIKTQAKAFTMAAGIQVIIDLQADAWLNDSGMLYVAGKIEFWSSATGSYDYKFNYGDTYDGSASKTVDVTLKPSSTAETWFRSIAFIEA